MTCACRTFCVSSSFSSRERFRSERSVRRRAISVNDSSSARSIVSNASISSKMSDMEPAESANIASGMSSTSRVRRKSCASDAWLFETLVSTCLMAVTFVEISPWSLESVRSLCFICSCAVFILLSRIAISRSSVVRRSRRPPSAPWLFAMSRSIWSSCACRAARCSTEVGVVCADMKRGTHAMSATLRKKPAPVMRVFITVHCTPTLQSSPLLYEDRSRARWIECGAGQLFLFLSARGRFLFFLFSGGGFGGSRTFGRGFRAEDHGFGRRCYLDRLLLEFLDGHHDLFALRDKGRARRKLYLRDQYVVAHVLELRDVDGEIVR